MMLSKNLKYNIKTVLLLFLVLSILETTLTSCKVNNSKTTSNNKSSTVQTKKNLKDNRLPLIAKDYSNNFDYDNF